MVKIVARAIFYYRFCNQILGICRLYGNGDEKKIVADSSFVSGILDTSKGKSQG